MALTCELFRNNARLQSAAVNNPAIWKGEHCEAVGLVQRALVSLGYALPLSVPDGIKADGIFGKETKAVLKQFQGFGKLWVDGGIGKQTLERMDSLLAAPGGAVDAFEWFDIVGTPAPDGVPAWLTWNPENYCRAVRNQLRKIAGTRTGRAVLRAMRKRCIIRPSLDVRVPNAEWKFSETSIFYTPGTFIPDSPIFGTPANFLGATADASLLHEVFHAMRFGNGHWEIDQIAMPEVRHPPWSSGERDSCFLNFDRRGEFNAITVTNIYLSECTPIPISGLYRHMLMLVRDHDGAFFRAPLPSPDHFHKTPTFRTNLLRLWESQYPLCHEIAAIDVPFNPIRHVERT